MKVKVGVFQVSHKADMEIEAEDKMAATKKAVELLDTKDGTYILIVEQNSSTEDICISHLKRVLETEFSKIPYHFYFGDYRRGSGGCSIRF